VIPKPTKGRDYLNWLLLKLENPHISLKSRYDTVSTKMKDDVTNSPVWQNIVSSLSSLEDIYSVRTGFKLFATPEVPIIVSKSFDSLVDKTFRKNVSLNKNWPDPPGDQWITPLNCYETVNDIVRTAMVVKYLDGVEFVVDHLREASSKFGINFSVDYEAREEGYYAAHCYLFFELEIPAITWDTEIVTSRLEIQVTTQLQDVIRKLTHDQYAQRRSRTAVPDVKWQWDYKSPEFLPNYLGHILHYIEGMIMEVRDRGDRI
jgi:hypothetical protein